MVRLGLTRQIMMHEEHCLRTRIIIFHVRNSNKLQKVLATHLYTKFVQLRKDFPLENGCTPAQF